LHDSPDAEEGVVVLRRRTIEEVKKEVEEKGNKVVVTQMFNYGLTVGFVLDNKSAIRLHLVSCECGSYDWERYSRKGKLVFKCNKCRLENEFGGEIY